MSKVFLCTVCKLSVQSHMFRRGHVCSFKCVGVCFCKRGRIWKCVCVCVCVCVSEMLCMCDVVYPFGQALGMFAPSCLCVWARCCVCGMLCTRLARRWACLLLHVCVCERDVVYVGCCVPIWPGVGHVCSFMCVCVWGRCCVCGMLCTRLARRWACLLLHVCVCEGDVVYVGCCVPVWPGVGHVCSFMCVCERDVVYVGCCVPVWPGVGHVQHSVKAAEAECCCSCHSRNCDLCSPDVFASTTPASS